MLLAEVVAALEQAYPPALAEPWDAVGLVCGDPGASVRRVLFAVDPAEAVVAEALALEADLLVTHHPLYLRGTSTVAATTAKGRAVHALVRGGCGLLAAHTNADSAAPGVSDALADLFGLTGTTPLAPQGDGAAGLGRVGDLPGPVPLAQLLEQAERVLPAHVLGRTRRGRPRPRGAPARGVRGSGGLAAPGGGGRGRPGVPHQRPAPPRRRRGARGPGAARRRALGDGVAVAARRGRVPGRSARGLDVHVSSLVTDPFCLSSRSPRA